MKAPAAAFIVPLNVPLVAVMAPLILTFVAVTLPEESRVKLVPLTTKLDPSHQIPFVSVEPSVVPTLNKP